MKKVSEVFIKSKMNEDGEMIRYFGAGANRDADMMEAIIGRMPSGQRALLNGYELCIQTWQEMNDSVRRKLNLWSESDNFTSYFLKQADGKSVSGMVWYVTEDERKLIENWEFWYTPIDAGVQLADGSFVSASAEIIEGIEGIVAKYSDPVFLNDKQKMLEVARKEREMFLGL